MNESKLLADVWAVKMSSNFVYGTEFEHVSDHEALLTKLKDIRADKTI